VEQKQAQLLLLAAAREWLPLVAWLIL